MDPSSGDNVIVWSPKGLERVAREKMLARSSRRPDPYVYVGLTPHELLTMAYGDPKGLHWSDHFNIHPYYLAVRRCQEWVKRKTEPPRVEVLAKACTRCRAVKPREGFYAHRLHRDGLRSECKACSRFYTLRWWRKKRATRALAARGTGPSGQPPEARVARAGKGTT